MFDSAEIEAVHTEPFTGYTTGEPINSISGRAQPSGLKPIKVGPVRIKISFSEYFLVVDIHVGKILGFSPRNFKQMKLYPGHLKDSASVSYSVLKKKVTVRLWAEPQSQRIKVDINADNPIADLIPHKTLYIPYLEKPYPFPDPKGLLAPRTFSKEEVQDLINTGKRHDVTSHRAENFRKVSTKNDAAEAVLLMLGGESFINQTQEILSQLKHPSSALGAGAENSGRDMLIGFGARLSAKEVLAFDKGVGFYVTNDEVGLFLIGQGSIGVALEISAEFIECLYWGPDSSSGSALEAFKSVDAFVSVSAGDGVEFSLDFVFTGKPVFRLTGVNVGVGGGAGFSVAGGIQKVGAGAMINLR